MQINSEFGDVGTLRCDILRDSDLNPAFISAFSALAGAAIGVVVSNLCIHSRPITAARISAVRISYDDISQH